jgi:hypothetical protein
VGPESLQQNFLMFLPPKSNRPALNAFLTPERHYFFTGQERWFQFSETFFCQRKGAD